MAAALGSPSAQECTRAGVLGGEYTARRISLLMRVDGFVGFGTEGGRIGYGVLLATICGSSATPSAFVESGVGSASRATLRAGRTKGVGAAGVELSGGAEISGCSTSRRGMEVRVACTLEDDAAEAKNRLRLTAVTRNTTTIVTPS